MIGLRLSAIVGLQLEPTSCVCLNAQNGPSPDAVTARRCQYIFMAQLEDARSHFTEIQLRVTC